MMQRPRSRLHASRARGRRCRDARLARGVQRASVHTASSRRRLPWPTRRGAGWSARMSTAMVRRAAPTIDERGRSTVSCYGLACVRGAPMLAWSSLRLVLEPMDEAVGGRKCPKCRVPIPRANRNRVAELAINTPPARTATPRRRRCVGSNRGDPLTPLLEGRGERAASRSSGDASITPIHLLVATSADVDAVDAAMAAESEAEAREKELEESRSGSHSVEAANDAGEQPAIAGRWQDSARRSTYSPPPTRPTRRTTRRTPSCTLRFRSDARRNRAREPPHRRQPTSRGLFERVELAARVDLASASRGYAEATATYEARAARQAPARS